MLAGPWGLGRMAPDQYARWFPSPLAIQLQLDTIDQTRARLGATGVTPVALVEYDHQRQAERDELQQQLQKTRHIKGYMDSLILAVVVLMVFEFLLSSQAPPQAVIRTMRFTLLSLWLAGLLAQPFLFADISLAVVGIAVGVGVLAIFLLSPPPEAPPEVTPAISPATTSKKSPVSSSKSDSVSSDSFTNLGGKR